MARRITCINKDGDHENPYVAISHLGWTEDGTGKMGKNTRVEMHDFVSDGGQAYVQDAQGNKAYLEAVENPKGTKYVRTKPDQTKTDNLLALDECP